MSLPPQIISKLERSRHHFDDFVVKARAWFDQDLGEIVVSPRYDAEGQQPLIFAAPPVPQEFALIIGDVFQNLRSALDYLVWQLVLKNGHTPNTRTAFPVCRSPKAFHDSSKHLIGVHPDAVSVIESLQPYPERRRNGNPLEIELIDDLANENKHRQLVLTAATSIRKPEHPVPLYAMEIEIVQTIEAQQVPIERALVLLVFMSTLASGLEAAAATKTLINNVKFELLPMFEVFF